MSITGISSVWYPVADWGRTKRFYADGLGFRIHPCSDEAGWAAIHVAEGAPPLFLVRKPEQAGRGGGAVVTFAVTDAGAVLDRAEAHGGRVDERVQEGPGVRIYTLYDPDGNALELSETI